MSQITDWNTKSPIETNRVKTDIEPFALTQIPLSFLIALGKVFKEGELKYGKSNWKKGVNNKEYQLERANHALKHLLFYIYTLENNELYDGTNEDNLTKVGWFVATQCELERLERNNGS